MVCHDCCIMYHTMATYKTFSLDTFHYGDSYIAGMEDLLSSIVKTYTNNNKVYIFIFVIAYFFFGSADGEPTKIGNFRI